MQQWFSQGAVVSVAIYLSNGYHHREPDLQEIITWNSLSTSFEIHGVKSCWV
jgi:hypothetical protein